MAFFKTGDASTVIHYYGDDGEPITCDSCGRDLIVIAIDNEDNRLICECCNPSIDEGIGQFQ